MQEYGEVFAEVYSKRWANFAVLVAPMLKTYYEKTAVAAHNKSMLDLCCGSGQLCNHFLQHGYLVEGVDRSVHMLEHAKKMNKEYIKKGVAKFVAGDVSHFKTDSEFGLVVSTYDSLNHLDSIEQISGCFTSVYRALISGGSFLFDLNTRVGLQRWTGMDVQEDDEITLIRRSIYQQGMEKAYTQISGFIERANNLYERFNEVFYNTVFDLKEIEEKLLACGFRNVQFASARNIEEILQEPEKEARVFVIADK